jgi:hypothetical protein
LLKLSLVKIKFICIITRSFDRQHVQELLRSRDMNDN